MSTTIRPSLSERSEYWIERHRYYELKHFCLQYPIWKKAYESLDGLSKRPQDLALFQTNAISNPTAKCAEARLYYRERMEMIEAAAAQTDKVLSSYILKAVPGTWSGDRFIYDPGASTGMVLKQQWVKGKHYFESAEHIFEIERKAILEKRLRQLFNKYFRG